MIKDSEILDVVEVFAKRYTRLSGGHVELCDMRSELWISANRVAAKYDSNRSSFKTFAAPYLKDAALNFIAYSCGLSKCGKSTFMRFKNGACSNETASLVDNVVNKSYLEAPISSNSDTTLGDTLGYNRFEEDSDYVVFKQELKEELLRLYPRKFDVLWSIVEYLEKHGKTKNVEISKIFGISRNTAGTYRKNLQDAVIAIQNY